LKTCMATSGILYNLNKIKTPLHKSRNGVFIYSWLII
jgi:hypothetical protein